MPAGGGHFAMRLGVFTLAEWLVHQQVSALVLQKGFDLDDVPIIAAHHKTGSTVAYDIRRTCLAKDARKSFIVQPHFGGVRAETDDSRPVVHFMRDLPDLVVSAFLYHRDTGEDWSHYPGSAADVIALSSSPDEFDWFGASPLTNESYTDFLQRVPVEAGMFAEMMRFQHGVEFDFRYLLSNINQDKGLDEIEYALSVCREMGTNCTTVCLEDLKTEYAATWKQIFEFIGLRETGVDWECMQSLDYEHAVAEHSDHITANTSSHVRRALRELVARFDDEKLDGRLRELSKINPCDKPDA